MTSTIAVSPVEDTLRELLVEVTRLSTPPAALDVNADLYAAGLSSLATVDLMLAVEDRFGIEFTSAWLNRRTFSSLAMLGRAVRAMQESAP